MAEKGANSEDAPPLRRISEALKADDPPPEGRKGSIVAEEYQRGVRKGNAPDRFPTNEEVAKSVQQVVSDAVEMSRKYRHVAWYSLFVASYMVVLYLQANAYQSYEVVKTMKAALLPDGESTTYTFQTEQQVLDYIANKLVLPIWTDPVCGDTKCEYPWEFPAWGRFGCKADCGMNENTTQIAVNLRADFTGHPTLSPRVLMSQVFWNLCQNDAVRRERGEADLCWYEDDQGFSEVQVNDIYAMNIIDGDWYIKVTGDYAGRVSGGIYDLTNATAPKAFNTTPAFTACKLETTTSTLSTTTTALRRLMQAYSQAQAAGGGEEGNRIIEGAVSEIKQMIPELDEMLTKRMSKTASAATTTTTTEASK